MMEYQILFDPDFSDYAWEYEAKGCLDLDIKLGEQIISMSFYDPVRLLQEIDEIISLNDFFFERNVVVLSKITRIDVERAIRSLDNSGTLINLRDNIYER